IDELKNKDNSSGGNSQVANPQEFLASLSEGNMSLNQQIVAINRQIKTKEGKSNYPDTYFATLKTKREELEGGLSSKGR
ncbi:MAG: hypothetical protein PHE25_05020, partial [Candidatus Gracilibacteria bacterium]|nr:hypothetical protein [Candidatus Gracilibacteria bacterium]